MGGGSEVGSPSNAQTHTGIPSPGSPDTAAPTDTSAGPRATWQFNEEKPTAPGLLQISYKQASTGEKSAPAALIFVLDNSGSMRGRPWRTVQSAMKYIEARRIDKGMTVRYIVYNSQAQGVDGDTLQVMGVTGMTNFNAAFEETMNVVDSLKSEHKEIVVSFLTDGCHTEGGDPLEGLAKLSKYLKELPDVSSTVHSIGFGESHAVGLLGEILKAGTNEGCYRFADQSTQGGNLEEKFADLFEFSTWSTHTKVDIADGRGFQPVTAFVANGETSIQVWLPRTAANFVPSSVRVELLPSVVIPVVTCPANDLFRIRQLEQLVLEAQEPSHYAELERDMSSMSMSCVTVPFEDREEAKATIRTTQASYGAQVALMKGARMGMGAPMSMRFSSGMRSSSSVSAVGQMRDLKSAPMMLRAQRHHVKTSSTPEPGCPPMSEK
eukprot:TRINITY_DN7285_c0_g1_i2.p1 TRINITY_DN7285_c0_g1~~TRINITY_DN7285_c0_g1_i2.p1  ORF type:complete len:437 (+),score=51.28 TRINITY_DN7285_c0_g1_i2:287-1597(+)